MRDLAGRRRGVRDLAAAFAVIAPLVTSGSALRVVYTAPSSLRSLSPAETADAGPRQIVADSFSWTSV